MPEDDEDDRDFGDLPLPPLPPGISLPPPPPPKIALEDDLSADETADETPSIELAGDVDAPPPSDFQSQWEKRRSSDPSLAVESKDSMYGHIDRIATGEVGTLLDRFSDRFGSELDREIIVLRKKQQQDVRSVKATVELVSAPIDTEEADSMEQSESLSDDFTKFFDIVNNLLGDMPEDFIDTFIQTDSFSLFQSVGADPSATDEDVRRDFFLMINAVLGDLPEDKINKFVESPGFELFTQMGELYGE